MRRLVVGLLLVVSCSPTPTSGQSPAQSAPSASASSIASAIARPSLTFRDLKVTAAPSTPGDRLLLVQSNFPTNGGATTKVTIWVVPTDGSTPTQVVSYSRSQSPYVAYDVLSLARQLTSDGRRLVLSDADDLAGRGLAVVDLVAGTTRLIAIDGIANQPAWSPDGEWIAYRAATLSGPVQSDAGVWMVGANGVGTRQLAAPETSAGATQILGWTEDGSGVVYGSRAKLNVVEIASGSVRQIGGAVAGSFPIAIRQKRPSFAAVFDESTGGTTIGQVEVRDSASGAGRILTRYGPAEATFLNDATWRPGTDELLLRWEVGQGLGERDELVVVDAVSGKRRTIATPGPVRTETWTPDGGQIAYAGFAEARIRSADGSNDRALFRPAAAANEVAFVTRIAALPAR